MVDAGMAPGANDQRYFIVVRVFGLHDFIHRRRAVTVLLVPLADYEHRRHLERLRSHPFVDGLKRPEIGIGWILQDLANEGNGFDAPLAREIACGTCLAIKLVIVT